MVDDALKHIGEIGVRLYLVELGSFDQGTDGRPAFGATITARKQMVFAAKRYRADSAFNGIGVEFDASSSRNRLSPFQRVNAYRIASASLLLGIRGNCAPSHCFNCMMSSRAMAWRTASRSSGVLP